MAKQPVSASESDHVGTTAEELEKLKTRRATEETHHTCIQALAMKHIVKQLEQIQEKLNSIEDRLAMGGTKMALLDERTTNMGRIIWGAAASIGLGLLAILGSAVIWVIAKAGGHP
jgi:hypothetical protein